MGLGLIESKGQGISLSFKMNRPDNISKLLTLTIRGLEIKLVDFNQHVLNVGVGWGGENRIEK